MDIKNTIGSLTITDFQIYTPTFEKPQTELMKRPKGRYGISFAIDGEAVYRHRGKSYVSDRDHVILYPQGKNYVMECTKPGSFTLVNFEAIGFDLEDFLCIKIPNVEKFLKDHEAITKIASLKLPNWRLEVMSILYNILSRILTYTYSDSSSPVLWAAIDYIMENIKNPDLCVKDMANAVGFSEVHFRKLFKNNYSISPKQYLQNLRLETAKNLLETGNTSISNIAIDCGYSTIFYFSKLFKLKTGYSPYEYRERYRKIY